MNVIKAENLVCKCGYPYKRHNSLDDVSLDVAGGELLCVLGAADAGKTALAHALMGLILPEGGKLTVSQIDASDPKRQSELRKKCALVFENAEELYLTNAVQTELYFAAENFGVDRWELEARATKALSFVGLEGYEGRSMPLISPFERYCVAIAAALVYDPEIIIFDSVAEGFEETERARIFQIMLELRKKGKTVIYTSRIAQDAVVADRVLLMKEGRGLGCDAPRRILPDKDLMTSAELELPFTVKVYHDLLDDGVRLETCPLTIDELVEEICR